MKHVLKEAAGSLAAIILISSAQSPHFAEARSQLQQSQQLGQLTTVATSDQVTIDLYRPQIVADADGSYAIAWEALEQEEFVTEWKIGVQRFGPNGSVVGPSNVFDPESGCLAVDHWLDDGQQNVELAFDSSGGLLVLMEHFGEFFVVNSGSNSSEITLGLVDQSGQITDISNDENCVQRKFIFVGADEQDRPRFALMPTAIALIVDGFFGGTNFRNVGLQFYDYSLSEIGGVTIPHDDENSLEGFHAYPDLATNGTLMAYVWHECPFIDNQGNVAECDVMAQFATTNGTVLTAVGGNIRVNSGDPVGTGNFRPSVAMAPSGSSVVVWQDARFGPGGDVFGQVFDSNGQPVNGNFQISETGGTLETTGGLRPEVAMRNDGSFMVVWGDKTSVRRALGRQYNHNAQPISGATLLASEAGMEFGMPALASNGTEYFVTGLSLASDGTLGVFSVTPPESNIAVEDADEVVPSITLDAYPNPFREAATIVARLPETGQLSTLR